MTVLLLVEERIDQDYLFELPFWYENSGDYKENQARPQNVHLFAFIHSLEKEFGLFKNTSLGAPNVFRSQGQYTSPGNRFGCHHESNPDSKFALREFAREYVVTRTGRRMTRRRDDAWPRPHNLYVSQELIWGSSYVQSLKKDERFQYGVWWRPSKPLTSELEAHTVRDKLLWLIEDDGQLLQDYTFRPFKDSSWPITWNHEVLRPSPSLPLTALSAV